MIKLFRTIIQVSDIDKAEGFYKNLLGIPGKRVHTNRHYFDCGGTILACVDPSPIEGPTPAQPNPDYIYFAVDNLEEYFERAKVLDFMSLEKQIASRPWGERSFYGKDPFGNPICFVDTTTMFTG